MKSVLNRTHCEIVIDKSRFIGLCHPLQDANDVVKLLAEAKMAFPDATHYCFAYRIGSQAQWQKASDDGEPAKTAGVPILEILRKNDVTDCLIIVVRYFGGTLLGAGGLIRAYAKTAREVLAISSYVYPHTYANLTVRISYPHVGSVEHWIRKCDPLVKITFSEVVSFAFRAEVKIIPELETTLRNAVGKELVFEISESFTLYLK